MDSLFFVSWPSAPLTELLVRNALLALPNINSASICSIQPQSFSKLIQWSSYDEIDHQLTHSAHHDVRVRSSSYIIRKALIRKHFLSRCIHSYLTKNPDSVLRTAVPRTWEIEISFADELEALWADELYDLSDILDKLIITSPETDDRWWILKPGMADRGMGIRLFNSKDGLRRVLEKFDDDDDDPGHGGDEDDGGATAHDYTSVVISQLRHFVIQASSGICYSRKTYFDGRHPLHPISHKKRIGIPDQSSPTGSARSSTSPVWRSLFTTHRSTAGS
jgi:tubulin---tyrosine ligase